MYLAKGVGTVSTPVNVLPSELPPFAIGIYSQRAGAKAPATPLLDPTSLKTACEAYDRAEEVLRTRSRAALRPSVRHSLANKVLSFAIFGERNLRLLADRALAHFP